MNSPAPTSLALWEIEARLLRLVAKQTGLPAGQVKLDSRLVEDLGLDSLELVELVMAIEDEFAVTIPDDLPRAVFVREPLTVRGLAEVVQHCQGSGTPTRTDWLAAKPLPAAAPTAPFTQLGGALTVSNWLSGPLFEPMPPTAEGGQQFRRQTDGMRCILLPAAEVELGCEDDPALPDQRPRHRAFIETVLMDAEPVSVLAWCRFLNSVQPESETFLEWCGLPPQDRRTWHLQIREHRQVWEPVPGTEMQPMVLVSWFGANAYALWANRRDWRWYRGDGSVPDGLQRRQLPDALIAHAPPPTGLPSEAQWEYAARGAQWRPFPWGDASVTPQLARIWQHTARKDYADRLPLAEVHERLGMSPYGLHHMAGNVWQWCADWYAPEFYHSPSATQPNPLNTHPTGIRSERGGSWVGPAELSRSSYRRGRRPYAKGRCLGFRCVSDSADLPPS